MRYALKLAYDGRFFHGFARQPNVQTVENSLIKLCVNLNIFKDPKTAMYRAASRTDKGVSSFGNVISFNTKKDLNLFIDECNELLDHICIYGIKKVEEEFYPRHAQQRTYRYYLPKDVNYTFESIRSTALLFKGTHDFTNFARIEPHKNPVRTIRKITIKETDDFFIIDIYAQTFLWHQIRRILSSIIQVEQQKITRDEISYALHHPNESFDYGVASPKYLVLMDVTYYFSFTQITKGLKKKETIERSLLHEFKCPFSKNANKTKQKTPPAIKEE